jgi:hypothetical protein
VTELHDTPSATLQRYAIPGGGVLPLQPKPVVFPVMVPRHGPWPAIPFASCTQLPLDVVPPSTNVVRIQHVALPPEGTAQSPSFMQGWPGPLGPDPLEKTLRHDGPLLGIEQKSGWVDACCVS